MARVRLIGAVALSLLSATPVLAAQHVDFGHYSHSRGALPTQRARNFNNAYGFDRGANFTFDNLSADFDRRNTFN